MRRLMLLAVLAPAFAAAAASTASAYVLDAGTRQFTNPPVGGIDAPVPIVGSAVTRNPLVVALVRNGVRYWEGYPQSCAAGLHVNLSTDDPDGGMSKVYNAWVDDDDLCTMYLNVRNADWPITARNAFSWCPIIAHEMGHMLGLYHSKDPRNLMTGGYIGPVDPDCNAFRRKGQPKAKSKLPDPYYDAQGHHLTPEQRAARAAAGKS